MSEFKIGDTVKRISHNRIDMHVGYVGKVTALSVGNMIRIDNSDSLFDSSCFVLVTPATPVPNLPSRKSPIVERVVTTKTKELVPGQYGRLDIMRKTGGFIVFGVGMAAWTAPELRDAAATLIELAEFLEEGKN